MPSALKTIPEPSSALALERELAELSGWSDLRLAPPDEGNGWYGTYVDPTDGQVYHGSGVPSWARQDADAFDLMVEARCFPRDSTSDGRTFAIVSPVTVDGRWAGSTVVEPFDAHPDGRTAMRIAIVKAAITVRRSTVEASL